MTANADPDRDRDRWFAPAARYMAAERAGIRFYDRRTGQERYTVDHDRPTSVILREREAGVGVETRDDVAEVVTSCSLGNYQPPSGRWVARINVSRPARRWEPRHTDAPWVPEFRDVDDPEAAMYDYATSYSRSEVFDSREAAVEWLCAEVPGFEDADRADAVAIREDGDADETAEETTEQAELIDGNGVGAP